MTLISAFALDSVGAFPFTKLSLLSIPLFSLSHLHFHHFVLFCFLIVIEINAIEVLFFGFELLSIQICW